MTKENQIRETTANPSDDLMFGLAWGEVCPNKGSLSIIQLACNNYKKEISDYDFSKDSENFFDYAKCWIKNHYSEYV